MPDFEPIHTQDQFDERIKARLAREREKWEKEDTRVATLRSELSQAQAEVEQLKASQRREKVTEAIQKALVAAGHTDEVKNARILKLVDLDSVEHDDSGMMQDGDIRLALKSVQDAVPELFSEGQEIRVGAPDASGYVTPTQPRTSPSSGELTEEQVRGMSTEDINSNWDKVKDFLAGRK